MLPEREGRTWQSVVMKPSAFREKGISQMNIGEIQVSLLAVAWRKHPVDILLSESEEQRQIIHQTFPDGTIDNAQSVLLLRRHENFMLIDAGLAASVSALLARLKQLDVTPDMITRIVATHAHGDHIGGFTQDGQAVFPNARLFVSEKEYYFWEDAKNQSAWPAIAAVWKQSLAPYRQKIEVVDADVRANLPGFPEVSLIPLYGHTPGHCGIFIDAPSGDTPLFFWADLLHGASVQVRYPEINAIFDIDGPLARRTRAEYLEFVRNRKLYAAGSHMPVPFIHIG